MAVLNDKPLFKLVTTIGSDINADIRLSGDNIPNVAAHIHKQGSQYFLISNDSKISVRIDGKLVTKHALRDAETISIGSHHLVFYSILPPENNPEDESKESEQELAAYRRLLEFSRRLSSEEEIPKILNALMDEVIAVTQAEKGFLVLLQDNKPQICVARKLDQEALSLTSDELSDSILNRVLSSKMPVIVSDALNDDEFASSRSVINWRLSSVMCVPLIHRGILFGAIYVGNNSLINAFNTHSLEILTIFAGQASLLVQNAIETKNLKTSLEYTHFGEIIGTCSSMQQVFRNLDKMSTTNVNVLIVGETGTGRELIARELHRRSSRAHSSIIVVNNGIIPDNFLDKEATLFLDEISEIPISTQTQLFKILQNSPIRVVASTQQPLKPDDLFYRLNFIPISVPALRDRGNDVLVIANYFLHRYAELHHKTISGMSEAAQNAMLNYRWPGNVRQLENRIRRAVIMCEGTRIEVNDLDIETIENTAILPLQAAIDQFRQQYISSALERNAGNRTQTAKELGVDPRTVFRHLEDKRR